MPSSEARLVALLCAGLTLATPALAWSRPKPTPAPDVAEKAKDDAKALAAQADRDYKLGHFDDALAGYEKAYQTYPVPGLLFNIAQCHKALKHWERAQFFYQGYLRDRPDAPNRAAVEVLLDEVKKGMAEDADKQKRDEEERRQQEQDAREQARDAREAEERRRAEEEERRRALFGAQQPHERTPVTKKWWFWAAVSGAALVAGGTILYLASDTTEVPPAGTLGVLDWR